MRLLIGSQISVENPSSELLRFLTNSLTFKNPQYDKVKRFSRYSYTTVQPYLMYYNEYPFGIDIPIGADLKDFSFEEVVDERILSRVIYPKFCLELRDTQKEAVQSYLDKNKTYKLNGACQIPTGKGKSILALFLAQKLGQKTLIVVHKDDLVTGWKADIAKAFDNKLKVGLIKAKSRVVGEQITIATVQTLNRLDVDDLHKLYSTFGLVVQDECHHAPSTSFGLINSFKARYRLALTATPERNDGLSHIINLYYGGFFYKYEAKGNDEDILPVEVIPREVSFALEPQVVRETYTKSGARMFRYRLAEEKDPEEALIGISTIPYDQRPKVTFMELDNEAVNDVMNEVCIDIYHEYEQGHSCVAFFTQKEHIRLYYSYLQNYIDNEEDIVCYYGDNKENDKVLALAKTKRKLVTLTTYAKATEGTNVPQWEVAFFVSSMNNGKNVEQAVGRVRRSYPDKLQVARVYDYNYLNYYLLRKHFETRKARYKQLGFKILGEEKPKAIFKKGYL